MEEPLGFVRDNPFVKNDGCRRLFRRQVVNERPSGTIVAVEATKMFSLRVTKPRTSIPENKEEQENDKKVTKKMDDQISIGSSSDIEYGPGIVEKLKAKFHRLSGMASREAKVSPHATGKRCPSMDDILASNDDDNVWEEKVEPLSPLHRVHSKSTGDVFADPSLEERRAFHLHRVVRIGDEDDEVESIQSISALRSKFEANVKRTPSQNMRHARSSYVSRRPARPTSVDLSNEKITEVVPPRAPRHQEPPVTTDSYPSSNYTYSSYVPSIRPIESREPPKSILIEQRSPASVPEHHVKLAPKKEVPLRVLEVLNQPVDDEPEFVKIGRRLKKSPHHLEDMPDEIELKKDLPSDYAISISKSYNDTSRNYVYRSQEPVQAVQPPPTQTYQPKKELKYILRGKAELPSISRSAVIIREPTRSHSSAIHDSTMTSSHDFMTSPPDPDSARISIGSAPMPTTVVNNDVRHVAPDASPPPEEPIPFYASHVEELPKASVFNGPPINTSSSNMSYTRSLLSPTLVPFNDDRGKTEMESMVSKFNKTRKIEDVEPIKEKITPPIAVQPTPSPTTRFTPTVVGIRSSPTEERKSTLTTSSTTTKPNVISISVTSSSVFRRDEEDSAISPISTSTPIKRQAPPPPTEAPPAIPTTPAPPLTSSLTERPTSMTMRPVEEKKKETIDSPTRLSLSSKYREEKNKMSTSSSTTGMNREKPYGDDMTILKSEPQETSVDEDVIIDDDDNQVPTTMAPSLVTTTNHHSSRIVQDSDGFSSDSDLDDPPISSLHSFNFSQIAGDGNPVRQSLISIVMEEDIPMLMEAMNEKLNFEFVDLDYVPSTSSIIHPMETRKQRRQARKVSSISFAVHDPVVYTYLDENGTVCDQKWIDGAELEYREYQRLFDPELAEEFDRSIFENWKQNVKTNDLNNSDHYIEDADFGHFSLIDNSSTNKENSTISV